MAKTIEEIRYGGSISSVRVDLVNNALQYVEIAMCGAEQVLQTVLTVRIYYEDLRTI